MNRMILCAMSLIVLGCEPPSEQVDKDFTIQNIEVVFMNDPYDYTLFVRSGLELKPQQIRGSITVLTDAKASEPIYAVVHSKSEKYKYPDREVVRVRHISAVLHLHSSDDLQGGLRETYHRSGKHTSTIREKVSRIE